MKVRLLLFAILRDVIGKPELDLDLPAGATPASAWQLLRERHPELQRYSAPPMFAVNESYVAGGAPLHDGDELALIPPVSGG